MRNGLRRVLERLRAAGQVPSEDVRSRRPAAAAALAADPGAGTFAAAELTASCGPRSSRRIRRAPAASARSRPTCGERLPARPGIRRADIVAIVSEPSRPQRRGLLSTIGQSVRGDYVRAARTLGRLDVDVVLLQHEYGIFGGARRRVRAVVRGGAGPAARRDAPHRALDAVAAPARGAHRPVRARRARDRDDGDGATAARRMRRVPRGEDSRRTPRRTDPPHRAERRRSVGPVRRSGRALPAFDLRADLAGQGAGDRHRSAAGDARAAPGDLLRDRRPHASRHRPPRGRAVPRHARAARAGARRRGARRVRRPLPHDRRALRPALRDRRLRDAVPQPGADHAPAR